MNYIVDATPRECIQSGTAYMVNEGYTVDIQTDMSVALSRVGRPEGVGCCLLLLIATIITVGIALVILAVAYHLDKWRATDTDLLTNPAKHGCRHDERNPRALTVPL